MESNETKGMSRRDFGRVSAAAGFAVLTGAAAADAPPTSAETLKIGLLGCGGRGTGAAQQMLQGNENVKLIALADVFQDRIDNALKSLGENQNTKIRNKVDVKPDHCFTGFDAYKKICDTEIDVLLIGTIPYGKPEQLEAAANAKKHVFIEKPVAVDPVGIRKFMEAAKKHKDLGLSLVAGTQRRHQKEYVETIDKIHNGEIGDILALRAYWCGTLPFVHDRKEGWSDVEWRIRNWINYCWTSGDNIVEQHVHNLDVCNWAMNTHPVSVIASGGRTWKPRTEKYGDLYDHFVCDYEYPNGIHMLSHSRHWDGCFEEVSELVTGTKGQSKCNDKGARGMNPYIQEHIDLINSIRGTGPKYHEGQQVAESTMTAIMGRISAYTGAKVSWEDVMTGAHAELSIVPDPLNLEVACPVLDVPVPVSSKKFL